MHKGIGFHRIWCRCQPPSPSSRPNQTWTPTPTQVWQACLRQLDRSAHPPFQQAQIISLYPRSSSLAIFPRSPRSRSKQTLNRPSVAESWMKLQLSEAAPRRRAAAIHLIPIASRRRIATTNNGTTDQTTRALSPQPAEAGRHRPTLSPTSKSTASPSITTTYCSPSDSFAYPQIHGFPEHHHDVLQPCHWSSHSILG